MPEPAWFTAPVPEITFVTVIVSERLKASVALFVTLPAPSEPDVPPSPIRSVPALIVVVPAYVFAPVSVSTPP